MFSLSRLDCSSHTHTHTHIFLPLSYLLSAAPPRSFEEIPIYTQSYLSGHRQQAAQAKGALGAGIQQSPAVAFWASATLLWATVHTPSLQQHQQDPPVTAPGQHCCWNNYKKTKVMSSNPGHRLCFEVSHSETAASQFVKAEKQTQESSLPPTG